MKNTKTIAAAGVTLLVVLAGASMWMRDSPEGNVATGQRTTNLSDAVPAPTPDMRAVMLSSEATSLTVKGKYLEGAEAYQKALDIQEEPVVRFALARALEKAGRKEEALKNFKQLAENPTGSMSRLSKKKVEELERS